MPRTHASTPRTASEPHAFVAYYRVSTIRQGESGLGLDAQRAAVSRYLASVKGELIEQFTEVESGKLHTNRPQLAAAIAACNKYRATLLIAKLDRLARNVAFISNLMESASEFVACDMPQANRLTIHIMAALAEHEREMISARTSAALQQIKVELKEKGSRISRAGNEFTKLGNPRWRESIGRAIDAHRKKPQRAEIRSIVVGLRAEGLSLRAMAARLNGLGLKTPTGAAWHASSVSRALEELIIEATRTVPKGSHRPELELPFAYDLLTPR